MVGETATKMMNKYTADPATPVYKAVKALFLDSGESPQEIMDHGAEWHSGSGRKELMFLVDNCPRLAQAWWEGCCSALRVDRPFEMRWRTPHSAGVWHPADGSGNLDSRCSVEVDDSGEKVIVKVNTPVLAVREMAAFRR